MGNKPVDRIVTVHAQIEFGEIVIFPTDPNPSKGSLMLNRVSNILKSIMLTFFLRPRKISARSLLSIAGNLKLPDSRLDSYPSVSNWAFFFSM
jgi:hypothetical protein